MEGWKLNSGKLNTIFLDDEKVWNYFNIIFSSRSVNKTSYKFGFIRSLIENLYNVDSSLCLNFDFIYNSFSRLYWNLVIENKLKQVDRSHKLSAVEKIFFSMQREHGIPEGVHFDILPIELQRFCIKQIKKECKRFVVGAIYGDTGGTFYEFDLKKEVLRLHPIVYEFMLSNQEVLYRLSNYEMIKYLLKINTLDAGVNIVDKVENITRRKTLEFFKLLLKKQDEKRCFYCDKSIEIGAKFTHLDHFIPWSFLHSDPLWNFVWACRKCNLGKKDKIAVSIFLEKLIDRNEQLLLSSDQLIKKQLVNYDKGKMFKLYNYSKINGFISDWTPVKSSES